MDEAVEGEKIVMGKASKVKGSNFERRIAKIIAAKYGVDWKEFLPRTPGSGGFQWKGDVTAQRGFEEEFPYHVECRDRNNVWSLGQLFKNPKKCILVRWYQESERQSDGKPVLLVFKESFSPIYVMVDELLLDSSTNKTELKVFDGERLLVVLLLDDFLDILVEEEGNIDD